MQYPFTPAELMLFSYPVESEVFGEGEVSGVDADIDVVTGAVTLNGPIEPLYAVEHGADLKAK